MNEIILSVIIFLPFLAALIILLTGSKASRYIALFATISELILTILIFLAFKSQEGFQLVTKLAWLPDIGTSYFIGLDGINLLMILLTSITLPLLLLWDWKGDLLKNKTFSIMLLVMQGALMGVFLSLNALMYYIFWELTLIPAYILLILWGGENKNFVTLKFFIYTIAGSLLMLIAFLYIYLSGSRSFDFNQMVQAPICTCKQDWVFGFIMVAFLIKIPVFPFHSWQPRTYTIAPTAGTIILSALMLKMGLYSILRWVIPVLPYAVKEWGIIIINLSLISVVYASIIAIRQKNLKTLFAWSSMAHAGIITAAIFTLNPIALEGSLFQMFTHGVAITGLFFVTDFIYKRFGTNEISELGGIRHIAPVFASIYLIILLSSVGLPLTAGFTGEFLMIAGIFEYNPWMALYAGTSIVLSAVYMLISYKMVMLGPVKFTNGQSKVDLKFIEWFVMAFLVIVIFILGVAPSPILKLIEPSVNELIHMF